ncbi:MAG: DUF551 domain-containing protein [Lachnospiraceae bacterium]|nr:DUF551 domain-containing protein [Lachnospiraceae bacterium]
MEWISVKDRLPEHDGWYLVVHNFSFPSRKYVELRCFYKHFLEDFLLNGDITHWMPLPDPPQ